MSISARPHPPDRESLRPISQIFGLLAAALFALAMLYGLYAWKAVHQERMDELANLAGLAARSTEMVLDSYESLLPLVGRQALAAAESGPEGGAQAVLDRYHAALPGLVALAIVSSSGDVLAASTGADSSVRVTPLAARARSDRQLTVGDPVFLQSGRSWVLPLAIGLASDGPGARTGSIVGLLEVGRHEALWTGLTLPPSASAGLIANDSHVLLLSRLSGPGVSAVTHTHGPLPGRVAWSHGAQTGLGAIPGSLGLDERVYAFRRLERYPVTAFFGLPQRALWASWLGRVEVPMLLFALALSGLVFAAAWTHRQQRTRENERDTVEGVLRDQEAQLRRQAVLLEQTQRAAHVGGWELDIASGALFWTEETYRIHETTPHDCKPSLDAQYAFLSPDSRELFRSAIEKSLTAPQSWDLELELTTARGRSIWIRATGVSEAGPTGTPVKLWGSFQDVSERHRADERIRRLAHFDELTSLANRNLFTHHLTHALARAERYDKKLAVLFIDLDRFKIINDTLGHDTGDMMLRTIARRLAETMRAADLVARLGGDEFVVVAEEIETRETAAEIARKLLTLIEQPVLYHGQELALTASMGIAIFPDDGHDLQTLLKHADIAMYRSKDQGKNRYSFYSSGMVTAGLDRLSLEARLKKAVLEQSQFTLHYQPKVSIDDGRITGAEALVRWMSPDRGLVPPAEFIPLAEETGLITAIGEWVLEAACEQAAAWARKGLRPIRVAVNLSARQFYGPGFVDSVRRILSETGVHPGSIELELTESVMMQNVEHVAGLLMDLKLMGLHISIDDFGTGYSSLSYLKRLPIDALKVDRSFVRDIPEDADDVAITRAVVALAHSLRLMVVAEGVETDAQLGFLRELHCDEIQGFVFSKPVSAAEFEDMLRRDARLVSRSARSAA